jgi:predicted short-subunit dehydrogenase-like oxidoreductase (DUF2520 family)
MPAKAQSSAALFPGGIAIVGEGRWGSSLHAALLKSCISPVETVRHARDLHRARLDAEVLWLCVPDAVLGEVTSAIAAMRTSLKGQVVLHSSGVHSSSMLSAARKAGAAIGSVHPLMTFPTRRPVALDGVPFAVESPPALRRELDALVRLLGGLPFRVPASGKVLYHTAAVMASPLLVSLVSAAQETAVLAGLSHEQAGELLEPIMQSTLRNYFRNGKQTSFSGPFARGDRETVSLHRRALEKHPSLDGVYCALALHALQALPARNKRQLRKELNSVWHRGMRQP